MQGKRAVFFLIQLFIVQAIKNNGVKNIESKIGFIGNAKVGIIYVVHHTSIN